MNARYSISQRLSKWGLVHGWLVASRSRRVVMRAAPDGFLVSIEDPELGERDERVALDEDPSAAAWRAITRLNGAQR